MANENEIRLHDLRPAPGSTKKRKRVGRGNAGKGGTYAGRGVKGQGSRTGGTKQPYFEGGQLPLVRRLPRKRGFTNIFRIPYRIVNVGRLETIFEVGDIINPTTLLARGVIKKGTNPVKVLAEGDLTKPLTIHAHAFSKGALDKIQAVGGSAIEVAREAAVASDSETLVEGAPLPPGPIQEVPVSPAPVGEGGTSAAVGEVLADETPAGPLAPEDEAALDETPARLLDSEDEAASDETTES